MSPTFIFDNNNKLIMTLGSPGGPRIIQYVVKTIIASLEWDMDIQDAISLPNFTVLNNIIELEGTNIVKFAKSLRKMGHKVHIKDQVSGIHAIKITKGNKLIGGADPRRSGVAIGDMK